MRDLISSLYSSLAPGAENLVQALSSSDTPPNDRVDVDKIIVHLTEKDWQNIVKAFNAWPFAPDVHEL